MAHDPRVTEETVDIGSAELRDDLRGETGERSTEGLPLPEDGEPGEAGLEALEGDLLEQPDVVGHRPAPLVVVVGGVVRCAHAPPTPRTTIFTPNDAELGPVRHLSAPGRHHPMVARSRRQGSLKASPGRQRGLSRQRPKSANASVISTVACARPPELVLGGGVRSF